MPTRELENENNKINDRQDKNKRKNNLQFKYKIKRFLGYIILFFVVFTIALNTMSFLVSSYSPDIDVAIESNEDITLNDYDSGIEIKAIDERLKWIQQEDEMPSVALRTSNADIELEEIDSALKRQMAREKREQEREEQKRLKEQEHNISKILADDMSKIKKDFKEPGENIVLQTPVPTVTTEMTKVYIGTYKTIEEAIDEQEKIALEIPDSAPFIKSVNGNYIVQVGSFSNKETAENLVKTLNEKGYKAKTMTNN